MQRALDPALRCLRGGFRSSGLSLAHVLLGQEAGQATFKGDGMHQ